jgi:hypothetical protein
MVLVALLGAVMATSAFAATSIVKHSTASSVAGKKKHKKAKKTKKAKKAKKTVAHSSVGPQVGPQGPASPGRTGSPERSAPSARRA